MKIYMYQKQKLLHLGGGAVDPKHDYEIELLEIGIGCGQNFILIKNIMVI